jgi:YggT family protein
MESVVYGGMMIRLVWGLFTLYMLMILLRYTGSWLGLDLHGGYLRVIPRMTDPLFAWIRRILPSLGPMDYAPLLALFAVWLAREVTAALLIRMAAS